MSEKDGKCACKTKSFDHESLLSIPAKTHSGGEPGKDLNVANVHVVGVPHVADRHVLPISDRKIDHESDKTTAVDRHVILNLTH